VSDAALSIESGVIQPGSQPQQLNLSDLRCPLGILPKGAADPSNLALDIDTRRASRKKHVACLGSKRSMDQ
jgi:hypothetical protein